ncbi:hypothetical protein GGF40_002417 [Coemansia sp. RSA 1286]|nr:hypothetical protein GGF40_002417 [Coemansia sp. RSA 1286]
MSDSSSASQPTIAAETEAQRRRRLRQERILNRGTDRLSKIKGTFSQVQQESSEEGIAVAGGHELKTAQTDEPHISGIALESISSTSGRDSPQPRRRAGNMARKARQEAEAEAEVAAELAAESKSATAAVAPILSQGARGAVSSRGKSVRAAVNTADINSDALHGSLDAEIADPAGESSLLAAERGASSASGLLASRRFSAVGLSRAIVRLVPVLGMFVYGVARESSYEQLLGESDHEVRAKWSNLLVSRPDPRREEWANGNYLLWYLFVLEAVIYASYLVLNGNSRRPTMPSASISPLLSRIPGIPSWSVVVFSAADRLLDSLSILLFMTAVSITLTASP